MSRTRKLLKLSAHMYVYINLLDIVQDQKVLLKKTLVAYCNTLNNCTCVSGGISKVYFLVKYLKILYNSSSSCSGHLPYGLLENIIFKT